MQTFQQDCVELALRQHRRGKVSRRVLFQGLAALGAISAGEAAAQSERTLVMVNWGGWRIPASTASTPSPSSPRILA